MPGQSPQEKRAALANAFLEGARGGEKSTWKPFQSAYPLATAVALDKIEETPLALRDSLARVVEIDAMGRASADGTTADYKLLELNTGYDWAGSKWERETKIETRLGDETITLRLARQEAGNSAR